MMSQYSWLDSIKVDFLFNRLATTPVVPDPENGSSTTDLVVVPAKIHGSTNFSGKVAKCASGYGCVATSHTDLLFL